MGALYSISEIVTATGGRAEGVGADAVSSISIDSREIVPGALFVAIRGENFDGHDFVAKAIEAGAVAALVSRAEAGRLSGLPLIVVEDALEGLNALARFSRSRSNARIVAVTGSVGKTSTKEAIRVALEASGKTHASIKSFNNHWGVPLTLARMPADTEFGVFEVGMNHAGEITPLTAMIRPHVAVVTTVGPVHIEFFPSVEAIADAKAEIFSGVVPGGLAIIGADHPHAERLLASARDKGLDTLTYGMTEGADVLVDAITAGPTGGRARIAGDGLDVDVAIAARGRHALVNSAAALLAVRALGGDLAKAVEALREQKAPEGRGALTLLGDPGNPLRLIDESYNANPVSMRAALDVFGQQEQGSGRRVLVLGDMLELGERGPLYHLELADAVLAARPDAVFLVGNSMAGLADRLPPERVAGKAQRVDEIAESVLNALALGDSVMLKGSLGVRLGTLVARIRECFATLRD
ncbi:UDP-N-acetylmuramoyl-tripeptide--D-alanyl-D-alanine ligase [Pelagibacterium mangrovi]|uniref:UDP-N-acetylmuramoyl-tripeptide--D-alanyl-D- alanine ligase n=1 Tax=Pelagibacterium mangrovi TaxID=3119828 RepID=UPI002FC6C3E6